MQRFAALAVLSPLILICTGLALYGPAKVEAIVAVISLVAAGIFFPNWGSPQSIPARTREKIVAPVIPKPDTTLDLAGVRIAIAGRAYAAVSTLLAPNPDAASDAHVRRVMQALLDAEEAWVFASLESTPPRPEAQIRTAAKRLMDDARERFPQPTLKPVTVGDDPFRAGSQGDAVFVVCLVATSQRTIQGHRDDSKEQTRALLRHLRDLADEQPGLEVFVSDLLSIDELTQRDPAMQGIA